MSKRQKSYDELGQQHEGFCPGSPKDRRGAFEANLSGPSVATPFVFLDEEAAPVPPDPGPRLFLSHSVRCEVPVVSSSISCKFVLQGEETYIIEGRAHRLLAGDFIIVDAGVEGSIDIPRRERTIAVSAYLGNSAGDSLLPGYGPVMRPPPTGPLGKLLSRAATKFARNPKNRPHDATLLIRQLDTAVHGLAVEAADRLRAIRLKKPSSRQELLGRLEQARAYLEENFDRAMTLSQVSRVAGVSPFHLNRHFSALFGEPPLRYHRRIRLERVADLLRNGEVSPSVAAEMLDYSDLPTFTRAFKSTIGVPPSALMPALS